MNILLKCPTRSRPQKIIATLTAYMKLATQPGKIGVAISCDRDDTSMTRNLVQEEIHRVLAPAAWHQIFVGTSKSKIEACNSDMSAVTYPWDIVVLVSDDMVPQVSGWDDVLRSHMSARFPDTNGILWCNDGFQGQKLNTLCIFGRKMYEEFGYIYHPDYKSLFCDNELTDRCWSDLKDRCLYIPYSIIRHEHPGTGFTENYDQLYRHNQTFWIPDMLTYIRRKTYAYDWSVLIPTIPGREAKLQALISDIRERVTRIAPTMRLEICLSFDNKETSIGLKRQALLDLAKGKYLSFVDDDDAITDAYVEDLVAMMDGQYHTMRFVGMMDQYQFVHSTAVRLTDFMATTGDNPVFQRPPNHLNPMLADIAKLVRFRNATYGEDLDWTITLYHMKFLQTEYRSPHPNRVHYVYNLREPLHPSTLAKQQSMSYQAMLDLIFTPAGSVQVPRPPIPSGTPTLRLTARGFVSK